jgi:hypothetical protein
MNFPAPHQVANIAGNNQTSSCAAGDSQAYPANVYDLANIHLNIAAYLLNAVIQIQARF